MLSFVFLLLELVYLLVIYPISPIPFLLQSLLLETQAILLVLLYLSLFIRLFRLPR